MTPAMTRAPALGCLTAMLAIVLTGCIDRGTSLADTADAAPAETGPADAERPQDGAPPRPDGAGEADAAPESPDGLLADAVVDAGAPDASDAAPPPVGDGTHFIDRGRCFEHTPRCGDDADCDPDVYRGCIGGRCHLDLPCGCASDADCAPGDLCITNERVCGVCAPAPARCPDGICGDGGICVDGWCRDDCPGHGDGPPLDCRGEPPLGRCAGWAYLREAGTCVPVDAVGCVRGQNTFQSRAACLTHCRGEVVCTATIERVVENTERRVVECPISHGPGACVALAHCLCELDVPELPNELVSEQLRGCAYWWTVPRGAITFADFCNGDPLSDVVARMTESGFPGPETTIRAAPGCADVMTDMSIGPACVDGAQNGWETGNDCGARGCDPCPGDGG